MDEETQPPLSYEDPPQNTDDSPPEPPPAPEPEPEPEAPAEPEHGTPEWFLARAKASKERREAAQREDPTRDYQRQLEEERRAREEATRRASMSRDELKREFKARPIEFLRELGLDPTEVYGTVRDAASDQSKQALKVELEQARQEMADMKAQFQEFVDSHKTERQQAEQKRAEAAIRQRYVQDVQAISDRTPLLSSLDEDDMVDISMVAVQRLQKAGIDDYTHEEVALAAEQILRRASGSRGAEAPDGNRPKSDRPKRGQSLTASTAAETARQSPPRGRLDPEERNALMQAELERAWSSGE